MNLLNQYIAEKQQQHIEQRTNDQTIAGIFRYLARTYRHDKAHSQEKNVIRSDNTLLRANR